MSDLLAKDRPSALEDRFLTALQWAGRAKIDTRREEAFLSYAIALEALLLGGKQDIELSYRLAIRGVHLVMGADLESRVLAEKQIRTLYGIRSKIVHSGSFEVSQTDLDLMAEYARSAVLIVLDHDPFKTMTSEDEFEQWFSNQLLGRPA